MEFEIRVGGDFSEPMSPSLNDGLELSIILNAPFAAGFLKIVLGFLKY
jgi:hypothetical protein